MSAFVEVVDTCCADLTKTAGETSVDVALVEAVAKGLGPAIYNADASLVSGSDEAELTRVRENFLRGKLGVDVSDEECDAAIAAVVEQLGSSNRTKYRVVFYYLLTKKFGKESVYSA